MRSGPTPRTNLGADEVIDYRATDFTKQSAIYDVVFDCVASRTFRECRAVLKSGGRYVSTLPGPSLFVRSALNVFTSLKAHPLILKASGADLEFVRKAIEDGKVKTVVDRTFAMSQVREAHAYSETGRVKGKIVLVHDKA